MKRTIIVGRPGSFASRKALEVAGVKNTLIVSDLSFKHVDRDTTSVIFENVRFKDTLAIHNLMMCESIEFRPAYEKGKIAITPHLIFVTDNLPKWVELIYKPEIIRI